MKKSLVAITITATFLLSGCMTKTASEEAARELAHKFTQAFIIKFDPDEMLDYCLWEAAEMVREQFIIPRSDMPDTHEFLSAMIRSMEFSHSHNTDKSVINDEDATITYDISSGQDPSFQRTGIVTLKKNTEGIWRVKNYDFDIF